MIQLNEVKVIQFVESKHLQETIDQAAKEWWVVLSVTEHQRVGDPCYAPMYYILLKKY